MRGCGICLIELCLQFARAIVITVLRHVSATPGVSAILLIASWLIVSSSLRPPLVCMPFHPCTEGGVEECTPCQLCPPLVFLSCHPCTEGDLRECMPCQLCLPMPLTGSVVGCAVLPHSFERTFIGGATDEISTNKNGFVLLVDCANDRPTETLYIVLTFNYEGESVAPLRMCVYFFFHHGVKSASSDAWVVNFLLVIHQMFLLCLAFFTCKIGIQGNHAYPNRVVGVSAYMNAVSTKNPRNPKNPETHEKRSGLNGYFGSSRGFVCVLGASMCVALLPPLGVSLSGLGVSCFCAPVARSCFSFVVACVPRSSCASPFAASSGRCCRRSPPLPVVRVSPLSFFVACRSCGFWLFGCGRLVRPFSGGCGFGLPFAVACVPRSLGASPFAASTCRFRRFFPGGRSCCGRGSLSLLAGRPGAGVLRAGGCFGAWLSSSLGRLVRPSGLFLRLSSPVCAALFCPSARFEGADVALGLLSKTWKKRNNMTRKIYIRAEVVTVRWSRAYSACSYNFGGGRRFTGCDDRGMSRGGGLDYYICTNSPLLLSCRRSGRLRGSLLPAADFIFHDSGASRLLSTRAHCVCIVGSITGGLVGSGFGCTLIIYFDHSVDCGVVFGPRSNFPVQKPRNCSKAEVDERDATVALLRTKRINNHRKSKNGHLTPDNGA